MQTCPILDEIRLAEAKKRGQKIPIEKQELAEVMQVSPATISAYYARDRVVPKEWYYLAYKRYRWSKRKVADLLIEYFEE